jgi:hypothetical protein
VETSNTEKKEKRKAKKKASGERSSKKKHVVIASESEDDKIDVLDITTFGKKRIGGRRIPANVPRAPMDNISFCSEECAQKWKFVY